MSSNLCLVDTFGGDGLVLCGSDVSRVAVVLWHVPVDADEAIAEDRRLRCVGLLGGLLVLENDHARMRSVVVADANLHQRTILTEVFVEFLHGILLFGNVAELNSKTP